MTGRLLLFFCLSVIISSCKTDKPEVIVSENREAEIREVLDQQVAGWNEGDLDKFMDTYWKSDSLQFIGSQITSGWKATLDGYKLRYPNLAMMGKTRFEILRIMPISNDASLATGKFFLTRESGDIKGIFTLVLKKINGKWVVIYDHTSEINS
jgi:hypothetical protein